MRLHDLAVITVQKTGSKATEVAWEERGVFGGSRGLCLFIHVVCQPNVGTWFLYLYLPQGTGEGGS